METKYGEYIAKALGELPKIMQIRGPAKIFIKFEEKLGLNMKTNTPGAQKIVLSKSSKANRNGKKKVQAHVYQEKLAHSHQNVKLLTNIHNFFRFCN